MDEIYSDAVGKTFKNAWAPHKVILSETIRNETFLNNLK
jgi:hypothetical protein